MEEEIKCVQCGHSIKEINKNKLRCEFDCWYSKHRFKPYSERELKKFETFSQLYKVKTIK